MGRMKNIFIELHNANNGNIPEGITPDDLVRMKELEIYNWEEYEKELKKKGIDSRENDNEQVNVEKNIETKKKKEPF
jgi:hypothetical protein